MSRVQPRGGTYLQRRLYGKYIDVYRRKEFGIFEIYAASHCKPCKLDPNYRPLALCCTSQYVGGSRGPYLDRAFPLEPLEDQRGERRELGTGEGDYSDVYIKVVVG